MGNKQEKQSNLTEEINLFLGINTQTKEAKGKNIFSKLVDNYKKMNKIKRSFIKEKLTSTKRRDVYNNFKLTNNLISQALTSINYSNSNLSFFNSFNNNHCIKLPSSNSILSLGFLENKTSFEQNYDTLVKKSIYNSYFSNQNQYLYKFHNKMLVENNPFIDISNINNGNTLNVSSISNFSDVDKKKSVFSRKNDDQEASPINQLIQIDNISQCQNQVLSQVEEEKLSNDKENKKKVNESVILMNETEYKKYLEANNKTIKSKSKSKSMLKVKIKNKSEDGSKYNEVNIRTNSKNNLKKGKTPIMKLNIKSLKKEFLYSHKNISDLMTHVEDEDDDYLKTSNDNYNNYNNYHDNRINDERNDKSNENESNLKYTKRKIGKYELLNSKSKSNKNKNETSFIDIVDYLTNQKQEKPSVSTKSQLNKSGTLLNNTTVLSDSYIKVNMNKNYKKTKTKIRTDKDEDDIDNMMDNFHS